MGVYNTLFSRVFSIFPIPSKKGKTMCRNLPIYMYTHTYICLYIQICAYFFPKKRGFLKFKKTKKIGWDQNLLWYRTILGLTPMHVNNEKETAVNIYLSCLLVRKLILRNSKTRRKSIY